MKSKWPDYLFTVAVRFAVGMVIAVLISLPILFFGKRKSLLVELIQGGRSVWVILWVVIWGLVGGIIAVLTTPRWQTPWYKRDPLELDPITDLESFNLEGARPETNFVQQSVSIQVTDADGNQREHSSLDELPPEIAAEIIALNKKMAQQPGRRQTVVENSIAGDGFAVKSVIRKEAASFRVVDDSGGERTYHSIEEMPAEIRTALAEAERKTKQQVSSNNPQP
jgi:hypothetical protein